MRERAWLREYAEQRSAAAFAQVVREYGPLVYSTCLRELRNRHHAEDAAQVVFILLARKLESGAWRPDTVLAGWLFETARFAARNMLRQERRRRARETKAAAGRGGAAAGATGATPATGSRAEWDEIEPLLHAALDRLRRKDRDAILLRFYQDKPLKEVGDALGVSAGAAQVRVARALEKLRRDLSGSRGAVSATALAGLLRDHAAGPTPPNLAQSVAGALARRAEAAGGVSVAASRVDLLAEGTVCAMTLLALKKIVAAVACVSVLVTAVVAANSDGRDPAAVALMAQFGAAQDQLQSFIIRSEDTARWFERENESPSPQSVRHSANEFRADAGTGRFARRFAHWGEPLPAVALGSGDGAQPPPLPQAVANAVATARRAAAPVRTKERPDYTSTLWDGAALYTYSTANPATPNRLAIVQGNYDNAATPAERLEREIRTGFAGSAAMGYFHLDDVRVDHAARDARYLGVREAPESVNGVECRVVEMETDGGTYTLWLAPDYGFHLARAQVFKKKGDVANGRELGKGCRVRHVVEVTRFEKVDGVWVPMEMTEEISRVFPDAPIPSQRGSLTHRKTLVRINPDFDALGAFKADDVRDGTLVSAAAPGGRVKRYVWKAGALEPLSF